jgi:hypothetical protein
MRQGLDGELAPHVTDTLSLHKPNGQIFVQDVLLSIEVGDDCP